MLNVYNLFLTGNTLTITFFVSDIILVLVSVGFLISLYIKTEKRSKRRLFADKFKEAKKIDDDTYIIPKADQKTFDLKTFNNPMNHLSEQLNEVGRQNFSDVVDLGDEIKYSDLSENIVNEEKSFVVIEKNNSEKAKQNSPSYNKVSSKSNKNVGNYKNFSTLIDAIKVETNSESNVTEKKHRKEKKR